MHLAMVLNGEGIEVGVGDGERMLEILQCTTVERTIDTPHIVTIR